MTTSLMVMLGCLLLTSYTMAIYIDMPYYRRDAEGGDTVVAGVKKIISAAKASAKSALPDGFGKPVNDLLGIAEKKLDKAIDAKTATAVPAPQTPAQDGQQDSNYNDVQRRFNPSVDLGGGWSAGLDGVKWESKSGSTSFSIEPTFENGDPGVQAGFTFHF